VVLTAQFSPVATGIRVDELVVRVPELPIAVLGLGPLLGPRLESGTFSGDLVYREEADGQLTRLRGKCCGLSLAECTAGLVPRPWRGTGTEIELHELTLTDGQLQRVRFGGVVQGVVLGDLLAPWGLEDVGGNLMLRVRDACLSSRGIERFVASGCCESLSLEKLTGGLGRGRMSGLARLTIDDLTIQDNHLRSLEAELRIAEQAEPNWIDGRLLTEVLSQALQVTLPPVLPERIEYTRLGLRLDVRDEVLYLFGTHGPREKTILTVRLFEQELPLLTEPEQPVDLRPWLDQLRQRAGAYFQEQLQRLTMQRAWETLSALPVPWRPPTTEPGPDDSRPRPAGKVPPGGTP
jgi:hypothetical protein